MLKGTSLVGTSTSRDRVENDYYATQPSSVEDLLLKENVHGRVLEPCVGGGHIADVLKTVADRVDCTDLVDRGYDGTVVLDFLEQNVSPVYDWVVTNPPYKLAQDFIEQSLRATKDGGHVAMFLKIQFLEGNKRKLFFEDTPPKTVYVFSKRQNPLRNGEPLDEKGKPWSSTMCFAWFVWEKGYSGKTTIEWI